MKAYAKRVIVNPLFSGSAIMVFGSNVANFFAYAYHFVLGRLLDPAAYGELGALLSLLGLFSVMVSFLGLVIVKYVSSAEKDELDGIFAWFYKVGLRFGLVTSAIILIASPVLAKFLHIDVALVAILSPIFYISTLAFVIRSFLQGLLRFQSIILASNIEIILRLIIGALLILIGFSVFGAIAGYLLAALVNLGLLWLFMREFRPKVAKNFMQRRRDVFVYAIPIFVFSFFSYALISLDVILVKHYLSPQEAGVYTVLSTLGKIIFFAVSPVSSVMFPIISKRKSQGGEYKSIFRLSMAMSGFIVFAIIFMYQLFPYLVVGILYGAGRYSEAYALLPLTGAFIGLYAISAQIINYYLSLEKTKIVILVPIALTAQVIGVVLYHDTLLSVILVSIVSLGALFMFLVGKLVWDHEI